MTSEQWENTFDQLTRGLKLTRKMLRKIILEAKMSTRAQIQVEGSEILIYKHCDGYPEGVIPILEPFAKEFLKARGHDPAYMTAQIVRAFAVNNFIHRANEAWAGKLTGLKSKEWPYYVENSKMYLGWGLDCEIHGDIEFLYKITADGHLEIHERTGDWSRQQFKIARKINLKP